MSGGRALDAITRGLVIASTLAAVGTGCWLLAAQGWAAVALAGGAFVIAAASARVFPAASAWTVLLLGGIHYGVLRLALGPALAFVPWWLGAFTGLVVALAPWRGWQAPAPWRVPLAWWATSVAVSWPIILARELDFTFASPRDTTPLIIPSALIQMTVAVWIDLLIGAGVGSRESGVASPEPGVGNRLLRPLIGGAVISALAAVYQHFVDPAWLSGPPWSTAGRSVGLVGDANPFGVLAATLAPLAFAMAYGTGGSSVRAAAGGVLALLLWSAAWFSGARSMLLITAAGVAGLLLAGLRARMGATKAAMAVGIAVIGFAAAIAMLAPRVTPGTPLGRLFTFLPRTSVTAAAYELLWHRDGYGQAGAQAFREHPVTGVGIGTFARMAPAYISDLDGHASPPDNAQNLWRQVLAERGVLGFLPILWLTMLTASVVWRSGSMVLSALIVGLGITLLFGFPLQDATVAVMLGTLVVSAHESSPRRFLTEVPHGGSPRRFLTEVPHGGSSRRFLTEVPHEGSSRRFPTEVPHEGSSRRFLTEVPHGGSLIAGALVVSLIAAGVDLAAARDGLSVPARAQRFGQTYGYGLGGPEPAPDGIDTARPFRDKAVAVLPAARSLFELRGWVRSPEGETLVRIWSDNVLLFSVSLPDKGTFTQAVHVPAGGRAVRIVMSASRGEVLVRGRFEGIVVP